LSFNWGGVFARIIMFAGHIGAALAVGSAEPRINIGAFIFAALLLDIVLWILVIANIESLAITSNFASIHQPEFVFPYSHGLASAAVWSALAALLAAAFALRAGITPRRAALLAALAVFSHWLLDALVHIPELPVLGPNSTKVGAALWQQSLYAALAIEGAMLVAGLYLFSRRANLTRKKLFWLRTYCLVIYASTVAGMTIAPPPPSGQAMAVSSLAAIMIVCALGAWLGVRPKR
jgi:membrane-bound metal-dependent hydrolase YbcI (DUF457 family)